MKQPALRIVVFTDGTCDIAVGGLQHWAEVQSVTTWDITLDTVFGQKITAHKGYPKTTEVQQDDN